MLRESSPRNSERLQSALSASRLLAVALVATLLWGCDGPPIHQDSPQAATNSLLTLYREQKFDKLPRLLDELFMPLASREDACAGQTREFFKCSRPLRLAYISQLKKGSGPPAVGLAEKIQASCGQQAPRNCTCGKPGDKVAKTNASFKESLYHKDLDRLVTQGGCGKPEVQPLDKPVTIDSAFLKLHYFGARKCGRFSFSNEDRYASVTVKCQAGSVRLLFRQRTGQPKLWRLIAFGAPSADKGNPLVAPEVWRKGVSR